MTLTASSSLGLARRKFFMNLMYSMSKKKESHAFWSQKAKMSLTANSWFESARRKFFMNSTYIIFRK